MSDIKQTVERLEALGNLQLGCISPYVRDMPHVNGRFFWASIKGAEMGGSGILSGVHGYGRTAEEAIEDLFKELTTYNDEDRKYVIIDSYKDTRSAYRWKDGIGWTKVNESVEHAAWDSLARNN